MTALKFHDRNRNRGIHRSTPVVNVAYKRSWSANFRHKEVQEGKTLRMKGEACGK